MSKLLRTPPTGISNDNVEDLHVLIVYPTQRVSAVTRVRREIEELLPNVDQNETAIVSLLDKLLLKINVFREISEEELSKDVEMDQKSKFSVWFEQKLSEMNKFVQNTNLKLNQHKETANAPPMIHADESNCDSLSARSPKCSSASSARIRLLELKAKTSATRKYLEAMAKQQADQYHVIFRKYI